MTQSLVLHFHYKLVKAGYFGGSKAQIVGAEVDLLLNEIFKVSKLCSIYQERREQETYLEKQGFQKPLIKI